MIKHPVVVYRRESSRGPSDDDLIEHREDCESYAIATERARALEQQLVVDAVRRAASGVEILCPDPLLTTDGLPRVVVCDPELWYGDEFIHSLPVEFRSLVEAK